MSTVRHRCLWPLRANERGRLLSAALLLACAAGCGSTRYSGTVLDADSSRPIELVFVDGKYEVHTGIAITLDGLFEREVRHVTAVTDTQGKFTLDLPGFNHLLTFEADGYKFVIFNMNGKATGMIVRLEKGYGGRAKAIPYP